jgi:hypothetical protein
MTLLRRSQASSDMTQLEKFKCLTGKGPTFDLVRVSIYYDVRVPVLIVEEERDVGQWRDSQ